MTDNLKTLLRESADAHPPFDLDPDPWTRGRRKRRRRQAGASAAVVAIGAVVVAIAVQGVPEMPTTSPPASTYGSPTLPDQLYGATSNVPDLTEDPLDGPAAVLYSGYRTSGLFGASSQVFLVSGTERDAVRVVPDADMSASAALSPDGTKVAIGPNSTVPTSTGPSVITVVDVETGETTSFTVDDYGLGSGIESLVWYPDNRRVAVEAFLTLEIEADGSDGDGATGATGEIVHRVVDTADGSWESRHFRAPVSLSADGALEVRPTGEGEAQLEVAEVDGQVRTVLDVDRTPRGTAQFSPDSRQVAVATADVPNGETRSQMPFTLRLFDAATGNEVSAVELGEYSHAEPVGWGDEGILLALGDPTGTWVERAVVDDDGDISRTSHVTSSEDAQVGSVSIARDFVDAPLRHSERPPRGLAWFTDSDWAVLVLFAMVVVLGVSLRRLAARAARR